MNPRTFATGSEDSYCFGPFLLDPKRRLLWRDGQRVPLYGKAFETLLLLLRNAHRVVGKEELLGEIWAGRVVEENNLSQSISAVRKALGDTLQPHVYIVTIPGSGYRFVAAVTVGLGARDRQSLPERDLPQPLFHVRPRRRRLEVAVLVLLAIFVPVILLRSGLGPTIFARNRSKADAAVPLATRRSVAIVDFENLSGQKDEAWLSTALAEMLHTELAAGEHLRVVSQDDVARAKQELSLANKGASDFATPQIGQRLGSELLVSGSYSTIEEKGNKQLRFDVRLQNTKSGETVVEFAETGSQGELFGLILQAGRRLRQELGVSELSPTETLSARASVPRDADATRFYAEGLARLRMFDAIGAQEPLQKAIVLDPNFSLAHAALADSWAWLGYNQKAKGEAERAFQLSGTLSRQEQLSVEGEYREDNRDWKKAVEVYRTLFSLFPDDLEYGLKLALNQTSASAANDALATLHSLRRLPAPAGNDPRIDFEEFDAWRSVGDFRRMEGALTATVNRAKETGALLLLARARTRRCWVRHATAEPQQAMDDCRAAQQIYVAAGDRRGEAEDLRLLADVVVASDVPLAMRYYQHALTIEQEISHPPGEASVITQMATQYANQGDHVAARASYEKALAIFQQLNDTTNTVGGMVNVGVELAALGRTDDAMKMDLSALQTASASGNKYVAALAEYNIAFLLQLQGDLQGAQKSYEQALVWFTETGSKQFDVITIRGLVELATTQGDFPTAHKWYDRASATRQDGQPDLSTAESGMTAVQLALDEGSVPPDAESSLGRIAEIFHNSGQVDDEVLSRTLLARCLLLQSRHAEALKEITLAAHLSAKANPNVRLLVGVQQARIELAATPGRNHVHIVNALNKVIVEAKQFRYIGVELEARLALGETEVRSGTRTLGRVHLQAVEKDASKHGFVLLARKARLET